MQKIIDHIYVGTVEDLLYITDKSILGVCKEPLHRAHARLSGADSEGYVGKAMPKDEPEYLWAEREHALYCNLIDAPTANFIPDTIIDKCMCFINQELRQDRDVVIVCNQGESRSPSIALMWLLKQGTINVSDSATFDEVVEAFGRFFYRNYNPSKGFYDYTKQYFERLRKGE